MNVWASERHDEDISDGLPGDDGDDHDAGSDQLQPRAENCRREAWPSWQLLWLQRGPAPGGGEEQPEECGAGGGPQGQQLPARNNQVSAGGKEQALECLSCS